MNSSKIYPIFKRIFDVIFALMLLVFASPIMILVAIAIKLGSKGPISFRQDRPGYKTNIFTVIKFRTMRIETENNGKLLSDMERMTKVGNFLRKTSIDELPQLFNIIKGSMSFIGPRPLVIKYLPFYTKKEMTRHNVLPGISGLAQINGRNLLNWDDRLKLDVEYVENISLFLDLKIFFLTIYKIIRRDNVVTRDANPLKDFDIERSGTND